MRGPIKEKKAINTKAKDFTITYEEHIIFNYYY